MVNENPYGNGTAIFTRDGGVARQFEFDVQAGMVGINVPIPVPVAYYSFGGWKESLSSATHIYGPEGIDFYTRGKVVTSRWPDPATSRVDLGSPADALASSSRLPPRRGEPDTSGAWHRPRQCETRLSLRGARRPCGDEERSSQPRPVERVRAQARLDGVLEDVLGGVLELRVTLDSLGGESPLEEMACAVVAVVEPLGVAAVQPVHSRRQVLGWGSR